LGNSEVAFFFNHPVQGESKKTDTFVIHLNIKCISFFWLTLYMYPFYLIIEYVCIIIIVYDFVKIYDEIWTNGMGMIFPIWLVYLYWARYLVDKSRNSRETCDITAVCPFTTKNVGIMVKPYSVAPSRRNTRLIYGRVLTRQLFRVHVYICANPNPCWRVHEGRNPAYRDTEFYTHDYRPYSKSSLSLTLNEWRFNLSFSPVSMLFLNSWRAA
jgi:hypothetical protein